MIEQRGDRDKRGVVPGTSTEEIGGATRAARCECDEAAVWGRLGARAANAPCEAIMTSMSRKS